MRGKRKIKSQRKSSWGAGSKVCSVPQRTLGNIEIMFRVQNVSSRNVHYKTIHVDTTMQT